MADLEEHALKRDKRFVGRLIVGLVLAALAGFFLYAQLTSSSVGGCAARTFGSVSDGKTGQ